MSEIEQPNPLSLDLIGIESGTDKASLGGDYLRHYERIFSHLRDEEFNFIEIGVFQGASVRMWERFFSRAKIIGVDIDPGCRRHASDRVAIEIGSQNDPEFLHQLATRYPPRVIIDDGSHKSYDVIFTFARLFPVLEPGGIYVIEDLHFHLLDAEAERLRGGSPVLAHDYVAAVAKERLGSEHHVQQLQGLQHHLLSRVDRIEFIPQAAIIHKKVKSDLPLKLKQMRPHLEAADNWLSWLTYSQKLLETGGDQGEVVDALRRSVAANPKATVSYQRLSEALAEQGKPDEAIEVLEQAILVAGAESKLAGELQGRIQFLRGAKPAP